MESSSAAICVASIALTSYAGVLALRISITETLGDCSIDRRSDNDFFFIAKPSISSFEVVKQIKPVSYSLPFYFAFKFSFYALK